VKSGLESVTWVLVAARVIMDPVEKTRMHQREVFDGKGGGAGEVEGGKEEIIVVPVTT